MKITILVENTASPSNPELKSEHGLSIHILHKENRILFDMGISDAFVNNSKSLGVDLSSIDIAVISHHHFDHGGGLSSFLELNQNAKIYLRNAPDGESYLRAFFFLKRYIGLDKNLLEANPDRFVYVDEKVEILPDVFIISKIELPYPKPKGNKYLYLKKNSEWQLDDFSHELILVIKENDGVVIISGCSHNGMLNVISTVNKEFDGIPIKAFIGGLHLIGFPLLNTMAGTRNEIEEIGRKISAYPIERVYSGHCTGEKAFSVLSNVMSEKLKQLQTGTVIEIS